MSSQFLFQITHGRCIKYCPAYKNITGSTASALALSIIIEWGLENKKFNKTDKEIIKETGLTIDEWKSAKNKIKNLPFIKITREGIPAKTWYEIDFEKWQKVLEKL